jgi:carbonic anhydrase
MTERETDSSCACCGTRQEFGRRDLLWAVGAAVTLPLLPPTAARAASGEYEAMVLACIDPRMQAPVYRYLAKRGLTGQYSQFTIAGAAIGVVAPAFADWHKTFWDNLAASIELHRVKRLIAIDHRDCGAAKIAYGEASIATAAAETETHRKAMAELRAEMAKRQPALAVETGLMALDGSMLMLS